MRLVEIVVVLLLNVESRFRQTALAHVLLLGSMVSVGSLFADDCLSCVFETLNFLECLAELGLQNDNLLFLLQVLVTVLLDFVFLEVLLADQMLSLLNSSVVGGHFRLLKVLVHM